MLSPTLLLVVALLGPADETLKQLASRDPLDQLKALRSLAASGHEQIDALLKKVDKEKDLEVMAEAIAVLGLHGSAKSMDRLLDLCLEHPSALIRELSARALARVAPEEAAEALAKKLGGKQREVSVQALARIAAPGSHKVLVELATSREVSDRLAGLEGLGRLGQEADLELLGAAARDPDKRVVVTALEALAGIPLEAAGAVLRGLLAGSALDEVVERRLVSAAAAWIEGLPESARATALGKWTRTLEAVPPPEAGRLLRVLHELAAAAAPPVDAGACVALMIEHGLGSENAEVRGTAARALLHVPAQAAALRLEELARTDPEESVRLQALRVLVTLEGSAAREALHRAVQHDASAVVREEAAVLLGRHPAVASASALRQALEDPDWRVQLAAAIGLGRLQDEQAIGPLIALYQNPDWRVRGAAIVGLGKVGRAAAVEPLIAALEDADPVVVATAQDYLRSLTRGEQPPEAWRWRKWWKSHEEEFQFLDNQSTIKKDDRYGERDEFQRKPYGRFQQRDVFVLTGGRDRLEELLQHLQIPHVMTSTGQVAASGLHSRAVFLSNCPGKINDEDGEHLDWFVRAGGSLFGSCWAITNTVARTFPGFLRPYPPRAIDPVMAEVTPLPAEGTLLDGVFESTSRPRFRIVGDQLIEIVDTGRCDVLVDSASTAELFGHGNVVAWFRVGHGSVLASANHFALPGMHGEKFRQEQERKSFALDRLGYSFEKIRELTEEGAFKSDSSAAESCEDLTILRLVARFVHLAP